MALTRVNFGPGLDGLVGGPVGAPAVIVIQEWWGITENVKAQAGVVSSKGYRVLIPDIYRGKLGVNKEEAHHLMSNLDFPQAVKEIGAAASFLRAEGSQKVATMGFCMGGALSLGALAASDDVVCGAAFYGVNFALFDCATLKKPVQGHFGALDAMKGFSDPDTGKKLESELKLHGNEQVAHYVYENVGHAFMNATPEPYASFEEREQAMGIVPYDKTQADLAWGRFFDFIAKHLA